MAAPLESAELDDTHRTTLSGGKSFFTAGISEKGVAFSTTALAAVRNFNDFSTNNDPYGEHDFGSFTLGDEKLSGRSTITTSSSTSAQTILRIQHRPRAC